MCGVSEFDLEASEMRRPKPTRAVESRKKWYNFEIPHSAPLISCYALTIAHYFMNVYTQAAVFMWDIPVCGEYKLVQ